MTRLSYRFVLTFGSAALFAGCLLAFRPGFGAERATEDMLGGLAGFWLTYIIGTVVLATVFAVASVLLGTPAKRIGLKDERDHQTERWAYAAGFWVLFLGSFSAVLAVGSSDNQMLATVILSQVVAIGLILAIGVWDELRMLSLAWRAD